MLLAFRRTREKKIRHLVTPITWRYKMCPLGVSGKLLTYPSPEPTLESLSKDVFERRPSTGSEVFSLTICLDAKKFVLISFFSLIRTIYLRFSTKPPPNDAKRPLPVDVRCSKRLLLKLPINTYFSLGAKCWLRGGVGGVVFQKRVMIRRNLLLLNPLNPKIKIWILICCPYSFPTQVVGRS